MGSVLDLLADTGSCMPQATCCCKLQHPLCQPLRLVLGTISAHVCMFIYQIYQVYS